MNFDNQADLANMHINSANAPSKLEVEHKPECEKDCISCILNSLQQPAEEEDT